MAASASLHAFALSSSTMIIGDPIDGMRNPRPLPRGAERTGRHAHRLPPPSRRVGPREPVDHSSVQRLPSALVVDFVAVQSEDDAVPNRAVHQPTILTNITGRYGTRAGASRASGGRRSAYTRPRRCSVIVTLRYMRGAVMPAAPNTPRNIKVLGVAEPGGRSQQSGRRKAKRLRRPRGIRNDRQDSEPPSSPGPP
jgi:hypothetical protein